MRTQVFRGAAGLVACICFCWAISGAAADQPKGHSNAISSKSDGSRVQVPRPANASGEGQPASVLTTAVSRQGFADVGPRDVAEYVYVPKGVSTPFSGAGGPQPRGFCPGTVYSATTSVGGSTLRLGDAANMSRIVYDDVEIDTSGGLSRALCNATVELTTLAPAAPYDVQIFVFDFAGLCPSLGTGTLVATSAITTVTADGDASVTVAFAGEVLPDARPDAPPICTDVFPPVNIDIWVGVQISGTLTPRNVAWRIIDCAAGGTTGFPELGCSTDVLDSDPPLVVGGNCSTFFGGCPANPPATFNMILRTGTPDPTPGACCLTDGNCVLLSSSACLADPLVFRFEGPGTSCAAGTCPSLPANDDCINAVALTPPAMATEDTTLATADPQTLDCGTSQITAFGPGVWYTVLGTGNTMTATTCSLNTLYDTQISVYCGTCQCLVCVDGNDDDLACVNGTTQSTVSWCTNAGDTYYVYVHGFNDTGVFEMTVTDSGTPCAGVVACIPPVPVDCVTVGAQQFVEAEACGLDTNGGCNSTPAVFTDLLVLTQGTPITLGGTGFFDPATGIRDTDWYEFRTFTPQVIQFAVTPEFPATILLIQMDPINGNCLNPVVILPTNGGLMGVAAPECVLTTVTSDDCLPAGFYVVFVAPNFPPGGLPCGSTCRFGNDYEGTLSALECPQGCCLNNNLCPFPCQDLTAADCQALGGLSLGAGILCAGPTSCSFGQPLPAPCCKGDANQDGQRDGSDIAVFINAIMTGGGGAVCADPVTGGAFCASDINDDGQFDLADVPGFVDNLLNNHFLCVPPLECPACMPPAPPGSSQETEFCGDDTNGGCNSVTTCPAPPLTCGSPPASLLEPLPNSPCDPGGVSICGSLWGFDPDGPGGPLPPSRDTDWWGPFTLAQEMEITVTITSNGTPAGTFLIEISDCNNLIVAPGGSAGSTLCTPGTFTGVIQPGTYVIFAGTGSPGTPATDGFPCSFGDNSYNLTMTCAPPPVGACCDLGQLCVGDLTQFQCLATVGNQWHPGQSCVAGFVCPPPCPIDCTLSLPEGEVCGSDTNGGCNNVAGAETFTAAACNRSWCGTIWASLGTRDTDWYSVTLTAPTLLTVTLTARVPADLFILGGVVNGVCPAGNPIFFATGTAFADCVPGVAEACLAPGVYWVFVADQQFDFNPCGTPLNDYRIDIACGTCPVVPNDRCTQALPIATGVITAGSTVGGLSNAPNSVCATSAASPDAWYSWIAPANGPTTFSTCFPATTYDAAIEVYDACPFGAGGISLACSDDGCCAFDPACGCCAQGFGCGGVIPQPAPLPPNCDPAVPPGPPFIAVMGTEYLIRVTGWNGGQGPFELVVTQP